VFWSFWGASLKFVDFYFPFKKESIDVVHEEADWPLLQCGNCHEAFFENAWYLKIFLEKLRLFKVI
jgi:hypothetical protein